MESRKKLDTFVNTWGIWRSDASRLLTLASSRGGRSCFLRTVKSFLPSKLRLIPFFESIIFTFEIGVFQGFFFVFCPSCHFRHLLM